MENSNGTAPLVTTEQELRVFTSELLARSRFAQLAGLTFGGKRDMFEVGGYERQLKYENYRARYERGGIAARIINAFPAATWHSPPLITAVDKDTEDQKGPFVEACETLVKRLRLWHICERVDRLACIGHYAVLVQGIRGQPDWSTPIRSVSGPDDILYLTAYSEEHARIKRIVADQNSPLFGRPEIYEIDFNRGRTSTSIDLLPSLGGSFSGKTDVHASRVIHIAENGVEDNIIGTPRLRAVWNYLDDLEKVLTGSGEMFWRDAKGRFNMALRDGAYLAPEDAAALDAKVEELAHGLRDIIQTSGIDLEKMAGTIADPSHHVDKLIEVIAGTLPMPKRLLVGSERGELASSQDENNWGTITIDRQMNYAEPTAVRPLFDIWIQIGALPTPRSGYNIDWPDPKPLTDLEKSLIALNWVKVFQTYASVSDRSINEILPPEILYKEIAEYDEEQIKRILELAAEQAAEREKEDAEERAIQERLLRDRQQVRLPREGVAA